jgi:hypothetical protein
MMREAGTVQFLDADGYLIVELSPRQVPEGWVIDSSRACFER